ncbi:IQ and ubiquitin-like domain-containing protein [Contarinia nasturtii]|uniref:IQ and ubiquitin-like domain-containing protein n=1 Tax=Contarinia nasturtii TaxID=265458 RepID=UPI0012D39160|nr:IQ and ubiquitin-like domain-containing protein [Contarinia nasturtii]
MYSLSLIKQSNQLDKSSSSSALSHRTFDKNITVRFELNEFDTVAQVYPELTTIEEVLDDVSSKFQLLPKYVSIKQKFGPKLPKTARLYQLCTNDFGILDVGLSLSDLANHINESIRVEHEKIRLDTNLYYRQNLLPDFISVTIPDKDDPLNLKRIIVEIINIPIIKPFLGGYINKQTGVVYHNAYTQTGPLKEQIIKYSGLMTRDTQTTNDSILSGDFCNKNQMTDPKNDNLSKLKSNQMAIVIQRSFRLYLWKRFIHNLSVERRFIASRQNENNTEIRELKDQCSTEISPVDKVIVIGSPQTRNDFQLLESKVQKWKESKVSDVQRIFSYSLYHHAQQLEFSKLLEDEIRILNEIERKRNKIRKEAYDKHMDEMLDRMGAPIRWIGYKNIKCEMDLLQCQKIRKLTTLYRQLKTSEPKIDRIEFLNELYMILTEEPHSKILDELLDLLKREQKMLLACIDKGTVESLRCRQNELFRRYISLQKVYKPPSPDAATSYVNH